MRKKNGVKKKICSKAETGWDTSHLSHDTMDCIVTQGWGGWPGRRGLGHDMAKRGHDNAGCAQGRAAAQSRGA